MKIFNVGNKSINLYLLDSGTHRLLIDSGFPNKLHDLGREMRKTGYTIRDIDYLLVTHFHVDHAGAVQELKNEGIKFILVDIQMDSIKPMEDMTVGKWPYTPLALHDNKILIVNDSRNFLKQLTIAGQIIATPGHSNDSITLLLDSGEAFIGDLLAEQLIMEVNSTEKRSWSLLRNSGIKKVYPSHGGIYDVL